MGLKQWFVNKLADWTVEGVGLGFERLGALDDEGDAATRAALLDRIAPGEKPLALTATVTIGRDPAALADDDVVLSGDANAAVTQAFEGAAKPAAGKRAVKGRAKR